MDYIKIAPRKFKNTPTVFHPQNKKSPHQNQHLCFRGIFVFFRSNNRSVIFVLF